MALLVAGVNYKNAPLDLREALALDHRLEASYAGLRAGGLFQELVLLSTCNRVEAYAVAPDFHAAGTRLRAFFEGLAP
ncbi:MAG TPA: glutamyl-tRNA reductase, partial [bacterium]|nr:glutamyl-tRNA reductase [bacterium]